MFTSKFWRRWQAYQSQPRTYTVNVDLIVGNQKAVADIQVTARCKEEAARKARESCKVVISGMKSSKKEQPFLSF